MNYIKLIKAFFLSFVCLIVMHISIVYMFNPNNAYLYDMDIFVTQKKYLQSKYSAKKYFELLKQNKYSISFGTSRNFRLSGEIVHDDMLNIGSLYSNPHTVLNFIRSLSSNQLNNINTVYYLIDTHTFKNKDHPEFGYRDINFNNYAFSFFEYLNSYMLSYSALKDIVNEVYARTVYNENDGYTQADSGIFIDTKIRQYRINKDTINISFLNDPWRQDYYVFDMSSMEALQEIDKIVKANNVNIIYYTSTLSLYHLDDMDLEQEFQKYKEVLDAVGQFYFLHYIEDVSDFIRDDKLVYFSNPDHLNIYGIEKIFEDYIARDRNLIKNEVELRNKIDEIRNNLTSKGKS